MRLGWITCSEPELLARLKVGKGKTAISGSVLDERLAARIFSNAGEILRERNARLGVALAAVEAWVAGNAGLVEWVRPDAGGEGVSEAATDALIRRLRLRLSAADPNHNSITTVRGYGFRLSDH